MIKKSEKSYLTCYGNISFVLCKRAVVKIANFYTINEHEFSAIRRDVVALTSFGGSLYGPSLVFIYICYVFVNK